MRRRHLERRLDGGEERAGKEHRHLERRMDGGEGALRWLAGVRHEEDAEDDEEEYREKREDFADGSADEMEMDPPSQPSRSQKQRK